MYPLDGDSAVFPFSLTTEYTDHTEKARLNFGVNVFPLLTGREKVIRLSSFLSPPVCSVLLSAKTLHFQQDCLYKF
jgi:hypothetical protein